MTKILIFGSQGQLARSLRTVEQSALFDLVHTSRPETDFTQLDSIETALDRHMPDYVINAAAYTQVDQAETERDLAFSINAQAVEHLANLCAARDIPLIHISTDYVYDGTKKEPYCETDITQPIGIYGKSKLSGEDAIRAASGKHIILRTAWVFSPYGNNFVTTMLRLAKSRDQLNVVSDQFGCPTYAPHLASGILQIVQQLLDGQLGDEVWGTYCMTGGGETNWHDFAKEIFVHANKFGGPDVCVAPIATSAYPTRAKRPANSRMDCSKVRATFGIHLPHWTEGVAECAAHLQDN